MMTSSFTKTLVRSTLISVFLATSAVAQSWIGSPPQTQVYISVVNVPAGKGVFVPAVWVENSSGIRTQVLMGEEGLTRAILYNQAALIAWVLARGEYTNPKVIFDDRSGDKDTQNPPPVTEEESPTLEEEERPPLEREKFTDCLAGNAVINTVDDLPIQLAKFTTSRAYDGGAQFWADAQPTLVQVPQKAVLQDCLN